MSFGLKFLAGKPSLRSPRLPEELESNFIARQFAATKAVNRQLTLINANVKLAYIRAN